MSVGLGIVLVLVLMAEFINGWTDAPNAIATVVSTRVLSPREAVVMNIIFNMLGALSGTAVAHTIGRDIIKPEYVNLVTVGAACTGIIIWGSLAWYWGLPISKSHALIAGLVGAALATAGPEVLVGAGLKKVLIGLAFSTILGFSGGYLIITLIYYFFGKSNPTTVSKTFGKLQVLSAIFMSFSHGSNDGQKFMGVFTLALVLGGFIPEFYVHWYVMLICSLTMGLGTSIGGWRIMKTMGMKIVKLETYQGFAAETGAALSIELASRLGIPLSTTHTISTSIMGVGASKRFSAVKWGVVGNVVAAWFFTFPFCVAVSWFIAKIITYVTQIMK